MNENFQKILSAAIHNKASDIHIKANSVPRLRIDGVLKGLKTDPFTNEDVEDLLLSVMNSNIHDTFVAQNEVDFAIEIENMGRFRFNAYRTRGLCGLVGRIVHDSVPTIDSLRIPQIIKEIASYDNGLVIVSGATGHGKSTTIAAMIDYINNTKSSHIVTIEDPIEIIHKEKLCSISQREVSSDTKDFSTALKSVLRQDPNVIMIGEMRDTETARSAIRAAETGHLVLTTLHSTKASDAISRILDMFSDREQNQIRSSLASSLRAVICQRLITSVDKTQIPAVEILLNRGRVPEAILDEKITYTLPALIEESHSFGMQTFEMHLLELLNRGEIDPNEALGNTDFARDFALKLRKHGFKVPSS